MTARAAGYRRLAGRPAAELMQDALSDNGLRRAVGIAILNALAEAGSAPHVLGSCAAKAAKIVLRRVAKAGMSA